MPHKEKDTIIKAGVSPHGNRKGILLFVEFRKSIFDIVKETSWLWLDMKSASALFLVPETYNEMDDKQLNQWLAENIKGQHIELRSHITNNHSSGLPSKLSAMYKKVRSSKFVDAESIGMLDYILENLKELSTEQKKKDSAINSTISGFSNLLAHGYPGKAFKKGDRNLLKEINAFNKDVAAFANEYLKHLGIMKKIIFPVLGNLWDSDMDDLKPLGGTDEYPLFPSHSIVAIGGCGVIDTKTKKVIRQATVLVKK